MSLVLGINAFHGDSAACLFRDGRLLAAAEEERFRRVKHWAGFPSESISYCLREAGAQLQDVEHVAINQDGRANLLKKLSFMATHRPDFGLVLARLRNKRQRQGIDELLGGLGPFGGRIHFVEHHLAHLASAFLVSPFPEAVTVSVDGFGDFASAGWGVGSNYEVRLDERIYFPHSLGIFYQAITQFLGFNHYGDEYKVMGLAPYGKPTYQAKMREIVLLQDDGTFKLDLKYFRHATEKVEFEWSGGEPTIGRLFAPELEALLGPARMPSDELTDFHRDLARSAQGMYEEALFHLLASLHKRYQLPALALAGGCAMNSVANGKVYERTPFKRLYVQAAAGDAGGAIGAAAYVGSTLDQQRPQGMTHAYWGPVFSDQQVEAVITERAADLRNANCTWSVIPSESLATYTAEAIARGDVVGWFQGRMEWGPRALGNRSIVCDPRRADMKHILNQKIKRRESFRPFAPSILREATPAWFETDDDVPFMMQVFQVRAEKRALIPAVTHVDGSGRLQTVTREANSHYYDLIAAFRDQTGVPLVLNTSFNENEPVVCTPTQALDCFLRTRMDLLVLGNWAVVRKQ